MPKPLLPAGQLIARVIKDKLAPKMFLNTTEEKRLHILKTMTSALILEGRLKTTSAKAKFVKFYADRLVDLARDGSSEAYAQAELLVKNPDEVLPKLFGPMAARYTDQKDTYTEVMLNGYRDYKKPTQGKMQYPDAAQMAIIEFTNNSRSVSYLLAKHSLPKHQSILADLCTQLSESNQIKLTFRQIAMLEQKKLSLEKSVAKFAAKITDHDSAWVLEKLFLEENLSKYQGLIDSKETIEKSLVDLGYVLVDGVVSVKMPATIDTVVSVVVKETVEEPVDRSIVVEVVEEKSGFLKKLFGYKQ